MTNTRKLKIWVCLFCLATSLAAPAPRAPLELDIIDMAAISRMTPQQLEVLAEGLAAEEIMRTKRSSAQALSAVASKAASGIQSKLGLLGQASAGAASFVASASSKSGHGEEHGYSYEPHDEKVDYWGLKKSILYTLFQAVKAITGGVTILKGQLIKGGGALAASLGRVISSKGDVVSNIGKKIVSSAALSHKKPVAAVVYGPPSTSHVEYGPPPSAYAAPTAPAHYPHTSSALSAPTGFAAHKYPSHIDGRGKLAGVHAGVVILAPLGDAAHGETHQHSTVGHTPLEPPPSILNTVYTAVKDVFSSASPSVQSSEPQHLAIPPPPLPDFKPMSWGAVDSYGEPASTDAYLDYDPRNPQPTFAHATSKHSIVPTLHKKEGLTPAKIQKINRNLSKLAAYMNNNVQRSLDVAPQFNKAIFEEMLMKTGKAFLPTPTSDNDVGVLPAELLPDLDLTTSTTSTTTTTTTPRTTTDNDANRRKDVKFFLRGNKIVQV